MSMSLGRRRIVEVWSRTGKILLCPCCTSHHPVQPIAVTPDLLERGIRTHVSFSRDHIIPHRFFDDLVHRKKWGDRRKVLLRSGTLFLNPGWSFFWALRTLPTSRASGLFLFVLVWVPFELEAGRLRSPLSSLKRRSPQKLRRFLSVSELSFSLETLKIVPIVVLPTKPKIGLPSHSRQRHP